MDEALTTGVHRCRSSGFAPRDVAVLDRVFADGQWELAALFGDRPSL
jgi:hypothetical protein